MNVCHTLKEDVFDLEMYETGMNNQCCKFGE